MCPLRRPTICLLLLSVAASSSLSAASPALSIITPRGVQRGTGATLTFRGARLSDAQEVLLYQPGVTVEKVEVVNDGEVKASVKVAPDCRLGEHAARVRSASGISELRTFYVGALPAVDEVEPNSELSAAQKVSLEVTVTGIVQSEDVDLFAVEAKKGARLTAEVEGLRLASTVFDPYVAILDKARFELSASDDAALVWQDAIASIVVPEDGTYVVQVRDSAYAGDGNCHYRLHIGSFPRPTAAVPAGGKLGEEVEVTFVGDVLGEIRRRVKLPAAIEPGFGLFPEDERGIAPSPVPFRLSETGNVIEVEPNDDHERATRAELPLALNGVISKKGDVDFFRFAAKKGQTFDVHAYARRIRSPLDPVMVIHHAGGGGIAGDDDAVAPDSYIRFTAPEDKEYVLSITDHLGAGGVGYAYRVEFTPVAPRLTLGIPVFSQYTQDRQTVPVPRGNRYATLITASRADFGGELAIAGEGLPAGITMAADTMAANVDVIPVVFEAAPDAPLAGALARLAGRLTDPNGNVSGGFRQSVELLYGPPNQSIYWRREIDRLAVAVTEEAPFKVAIVEPKVPLVQNGSMSLKVVAERKEGFKAPIGVQMIFNPPGVGSAGGVTIPEGKNEAEIHINANGGAAVRAWKIAVTGVATVGNGPVWVSSQLATLRIAPPYIALQMEKASVEQGKATELFAKVTVQTPFEGAAKVQLVGVPPRVAVPEVEITKETKEIAFKVTADPASPAGQHKNLFCQAVVMENGEPILHAVGGTELRIDVPLPPKADAPPPPPAAAAKPAEPAQPAPKRLTRLEKLRLESAERAKGGK
jgi:hypothetical protein